MNSFIVGFALVKPSLNHRISPSFIQILSVMPVINKIIEIYILDQQQYRYTLNRFLLFGYSRF